MAEDLGTWPPEQATVLLGVLTSAGLSPKAKRTKDGVVVTVDDSEADEAHRTLVANMDAIAKAARSHPSKAARPAQRRQGQRAAPQSSGANPRMTALRRPMAILMAGLLAAAMIPPLRLPIIVFTVAALVYVLGKQGQAGDR